MHEHVPGRCSAFAALHEPIVFASQMNGRAVYQSGLRLFDEVSWGRLHLAQASGEAGGRWCAATSLSTTTMDTYSVACVTKIS